MRFGALGYSLGLSYDRIQPWAAVPSVISTFGTLIPVPKSGFFSGLRRPPGSSLSLPRNPYSESPALCCSAHIKQHANLKAFLGRHFSSPPSERGAWLSIDCTCDGRQARCGWGGSLGSVPKFRRCLIEQVPALCQELNRHHLEPSLHGADLAVSRAREGDILGPAPRLTLSLHHRRLRILKQPHEVITVSVPILHICKPRLWEVKDNLSRGSGPEAQL